MGPARGFSQGKAKRARRALLAAQRTEVDGCDDEVLATPARQEGRPDPPSHPAPPPRGEPATNPARVPAAELSPGSLEGRRAIRRVYEKERYHRTKGKATAAVELPAEPYGGLQEARLFAPASSPAPPPPACALCLGTARAFTHSRTSTPARLHPPSPLSLGAASPLPDLCAAQARDPKTRKVIISDTALRYLLPPQLKKMTEAHKQMCGCETCLVPDGLQKSLNAFRCRQKATLLSKAHALPVGPAQVAALRVAFNYQPTLNHTPPHPWHSNPGLALGEIQSPVCV